MHRIVAGTKAARQHEAKTNKIHTVHQQAPDIEIHNKMVEIKKKEKLQRKAARAMGFKTGKIVDDQYVAPETAAMHLIGD